MEFRKMLMITLYAEQKKKKKRHRFIEQACVSYCSGVWEAKDQGAGSFGVW